MIQVHLQCLHCRNSLMDESRKIDNHPAIVVDVSQGRRKGRLYLSSLYGSYNIGIQISCPDGKVARFFCPHCRKELKSTRICEVCGAPMVAFGFQEGGIILICSRRGCKKHLIEFEDPELELRTFYEKYSMFFKAT